MTDSTNVDFADDLLDWSPGEDDFSGYPEGLAANDTSDAIASLEGSRDFPNHLWIDPRDWKEIARQNDKYETWPDDYRNRWTNQTPTHECTCHALVQNCEIATNRQREGAGLAVYLSPLSVYAEANPRRWGGSYMQKTLGIAINRGILPEHNGPSGVGEQKGMFSHTLNCSSGSKSPWGGPWVSLRNFPTGWRETAKHYRPLEVCNPRTWEQIVCLLLNGYAVSVGRSGHAIPYTGVVWRGNNLYAKYADSYEVHRYDSMRMIKSAVGGAYSIMTMAAPDDWSLPGGMK